LAAAPSARAGPAAAIHTNAAAAKNPLNIDSLISLSIYRFCCDVLRKKYCVLRFEVDPILQAYKLFDIREMTDCWWEEGMPVLHAYNYIRFIEYTNLM
jgi:hypothetical protein